MLRYPLTLLFLVPTLLLAQAPRYQGCHHFQGNKRHKPAPLTDGQLKSIQNTIARSDTFDILHYDIAIDVTDVAGQTLKASTQVIFTPRMSGQDFIRFDLYQLTVDSVTHSSGPLAFTHDGEYLRVDLPSVQVGVSDTLVVHYQGSPYRDPDWGGFYFASGYVYNLGIGLSTIPPNFGKVWYPCFDSFVERATYSYRVKSAGTYRAHCQGNFLGEVQLGGDTVVRSFHMPHTIPTYASAIAVADYRDSTVMHTGSYGTYPITLTAKPSQLNAFVNKMVDLPGSIDALEHWYGPYTYDRVGFVLTTDGALEIPQNIAYPDFMPSQSQFDNRGLLAHEFGHQWWGIRVSPYTHNEMWLKEGPAEYSGHLVEEWIYGRDAFVDVVKDNHLYVLKQAHVQDNGFQAMSPMPDPEVYGLHTYYKGASVLHNLRGYLGDTLFRQGMSATHAALMDTAMTAGMFRDALEAATGVDLDPFFDAWIFQPGFATFVVQDMVAQPSGGAWNVDLTLRQRLRAANDFHAMVPLDVTLVGADWQEHETQVVADGEFTSVPIACPFEPVMAILNGHNRLNQARMDHRFVIRPGEFFSSQVPYTDFRLYADNVPDSTLMYIEHVWAGPDQDLLDWGITEMSDSHYWIVDGLWPQGSAYNARLYYDANASTDLDFDLLGAGESELTLVHRASPDMPWSVYPAFTLNIGNPNDGIGYVKVDVLERGQYAFAKGSVFAGVDEGITGNAPFQLYPVPADEVLTVQGASEGAVTLVLDVIDGQGRLAMRSTVAVQGSYRKDLNVGELAPGPYVLRVSATDGTAVGTRQFVVE